MTLAKLLEQTREGGELLHEVREKARPACVAAVRAVEAALVEALGGEKLRGLPVLTDTQAGEDRYAGARVRSRRIDVLLGDKPQLVVAEDGWLKMAAVVDGAHAVERLAEDSELLAEDVEDAARAVEEALSRHLANTAARTARYLRLTDLAEKLAAALS